MARKGKRPHTWFFFGPTWRMTKSGRHRFRFAKETGWSYFRWTTRKNEIVHGLLGSNHNCIKSFPTWRLQHAVDWRPSMQHTSRKLKKHKIRISRSSQLGRNTYQMHARILSRQTKCSWSSRTSSNVQIRLPNAVAVGGWNRAVQ